MSTLRATETVGEIAARYPATVRVFQKHNIDFCCGGKLPLQDACEAEGVAAEAVLQELEGVLAPAGRETPDWNHAPLSELTAHIVRTHHQYTRTELPRLGAMMDKVVRAHGERHPEVLELAQVLEALSGELHGHLMKEEMVLFPLIETTDRAAQAGVPAPPAHCGSVKNPIRVMIAEHDSAGDALARMRRLTADYTVPADACNTFRGLYHGLQELETDLHLHIHLENNILFPRAVALEASAR